MKDQLNPEKLRRAFGQYLIDNNEWMSLARLDHSLGRLFQGVTLRGKSVLEIGAGNGFASVWCLLMGAEHVVAVEPEASGSTRGVRDAFSKMSASVGVQDAIDYLPCDFGQYCREHMPGSFDVVLMYAVINHLDEDATTRLHLPDAEAERRRYREMFDMTFDLLDPGGVLVIYDVGRRNFWNDLHLKNPFAPTIQFHIHQQPRTWWALLRQCGFVDMRARWLAPYRLRRFQSVLSNAFASYFLASAFTLRCRRPDDGSPIRRKSEHSAPLRRE